MKKVLAAILSLSLAFSLAACANRTQDGAGNAENAQEDSVQSANPFQDFATYEEAVAAAGYEFAAAGSVEIQDYPNVLYRVMNGGELFEIVFTNDTDSLTARKAPGSGDVSGDYNEYAEVNTAGEGEAGRPAVTLKGKDGKAFLAVWTDAELGCGYSLASREGMEQEAFMGIVNAIQDVEPMLYENPENGKPILGGWTANRGDLALDAHPNAKAAFEKAMDGFVGYTYEPLALLGSQLVAGMNYRILCRCMAAAPDALPTYEIVTIYEDLEGGAEITDNVVLPELPESKEAAPGGWTVNTGNPSLDANPEVKDALEKALDGLSGMDYEAVAYVASQVAAGANYRIFCRMTPVVPNALPSFALITIYADLDGGAEMAGVTDIEL